MSKSSKKIKKNMKKKIESKKEEYPLKNQIIKLSKWIMAILIIITIISVITAVVQKEYTLSDKKDDIITNEILASQTFDRTEDEYLVAFYEFGSKEDLSTKLLNIKNKKIYKVNLANAMNKNIIDTSSNDKATNIEELKVNGTTLIKLKDNKITMFLEGYDEIITYLNELN